MPHTALCRADIGVLIRGKASGTWRWSPTSIYRRGWSGRALPLSPFCDL